MKNFINHQCNHACMNKQLYIFLLIQLVEFSLDMIFSLSTILCLMKNYCMYIIFESLQDNINLSTNMSSDADLNNTNIIKCM